jgi:hypothetical protein
LGVGTAGASLEHRLRVPFQLRRVEFFIFSAAAAGALQEEQRVATRWSAVVEHAGPEAAGLPEGTSLAGQARGSQRGRLCEEREPRSEVAGLAGVYNRNVLNRSCSVPRGGKVYF